VRPQAERITADLGVALSVKTIRGPGHGVGLARAAVSDVQLMGVMLYALFVNSVMIIPQSASQSPH
jgi:hypothetical protein